MSIFGLRALIACVNNVIIFGFGMNVGYFIYRWIQHFCRLFPKSKEENPCKQILEREIRWKNGCNDMLEILCEKVTQTKTGVIEVK